MKLTDEQMKKTWEDSFSEQVARQAYNTSPVEALVRNIAYYLREKCPQGNYEKLHFMEMGCGAGPNLIWLAQKGIKVSGVDIAPTALELARNNLAHAGYSGKIGQLVEASVCKTPFADGTFDGILEACVFQHLAKEDRIAAFNEVRRLLKPGGLFVGYMLAEGHSVFQSKKSQQLKDDAGTLMLEEGKSKFYLTNIGLSHFFSKGEYAKLLKGFSIIDPCLATYYLPKFEAAKRGYPEYLQAMWALYAVK
ncbi:MAG: methyltransferase domain-containing protein [Planctomycetes bacterium]|nr:methyltransferase domain-containing protein [Planctomycetota bacterium]